MMKIKLITILLLVLTFSCKREEMNDGRFVELPAFNEVELKTPFVAIIENDSNYSVDIKGHSINIDKIDVRVEEGKLILENKRKLKWTTPRKNRMQVIIRSPQIEELVAQEGCYIKTQKPYKAEEFGLVLKGKTNEADLELDTEVFYYWNVFPCGGKVNLTGKTDSLKVWNFGLMTVDAKELLTYYAIVDNDSKGDCKVSVSEKFEYRNRGEGIIELYGEPKIIKPIDSVQTGGLTRR